MPSSTIVCCTSELGIFRDRKFDVVTFISPPSRTIDEQIGLDEMCSSLIRDMNEYGVCVMDNFIGHERGKNVLQEVNSMYSAGYFKVSNICDLRGNELHENSFRMAN